jgi:hypothetical protein
MSMLIRAGLSSRIAAMTAVRESGAAFFDGADMRAWLESNEITAFTDAGGWPTPETAELWKRFREEVLSGTLQKWTEQHSKRVLDLADGTERPSVGIYCLEVNHRTGQAWICTPDHQRLAPLRSRVHDPSQVCSRCDLLTTSTGPLFSASVAIGDVVSGVSRCQAQHTPVNDQVALGIVRQATVLGLARLSDAKCNPIYRRDDFTRDLGESGRENLLRAISWFTFLRAAWPT